MGKLTQAQRRALEAVAKGLVYFDRVNRDPCLFDLAMRGLIDAKNFGRFAPTLFITEAGRKALEVENETFDLLP